ncbi:MAG TPA: right-handed parallel beta-helix repeat-containing protein [Polyangiaceae bacterium]|nr:right-handed parallel beta-helix repeat-containing protein [Polyangiaceae bacterium]
MSNSLERFVLGLLFVTIGAAAAAACGGGSSGGGGDTSDAGGTVVQEPGPRITGVAVDGSAGAKVRQGYGATPTNTAVTVRVTGDFLDGATGASVGTIAGTITASTRTSATFTILVPHGAPLGVQPVNLSTPRGLQSFAQGVTITPITSAPTGIDEAAGASERTGTDESPFRSLTKALSVAAAQDTILLEDGSYNQDNGEVFPLKDPQSQDIPTNIRAGITIKGQSSAAQLVGPVAATECTGSTPWFVGLALAGDATIDTLGIQKFCTGIYATAGNVTVRDVDVHDNSYEGMNVSGTSSVMLDTATIQSNYRGGVSAYGTSTISLDNVSIQSNGPNGGPGLSLGEKAVATLTNGHVSANYEGIYLYGTGALTVTGTDIYNNKTGGIDSSSSNAPVTITGGAKIHDQPTGVSFDGALVGTAQLSISGATFNDSNIDISVNDACAVKVRGTTFGGATAAAATLIRVADGDGAPIKLDFGTDAATDRGENYFYVAAGGYGFHDYRQSSTVYINVYGNHWPKSPAPTAACTDINPAGAPYSWFFEHIGTCNSRPYTGNVLVGL